MNEQNSRQEWKTLYAAAMLESDGMQVWHRIEVADAAMQARLKDLPTTSAVPSERAELQSALHFLCCLKDILAVESPGTRCPATLQPY
jgi:hypothetical protein